MTGVHGKWYRVKNAQSHRRHFGFQGCWFKSNYWSFLNLDALAKLSPEIQRWRLGAVEGLGWVGMTAPILFAKGYKTLLLPSKPTSALSLARTSAHSTGLIAPLRLAFRLPSGSMPVPIFVGGCVVVVAGVGACVPFSRGNVGSVGRKAGKCLPH